VNVQIEPVREPPPVAVPSRAAQDFAEWARPALPALQRLARRLAPHADPDDLVQDALVRAWRSWHRYDPTRGSPTTWLLAIVADRARAARRSRLRHLRVIDESADLPDRPMPDHPGDLDLERALRKLTARQQLAVNLHYFVGLTVEDTAAVLGCSPGTVKSTLFDARSRLRALLGDDHD
jgi:RNA polymerase sigma-70 factor (ECF subfamily)